MSVRQRLLGLATRLEKTYATHNRIEVSRSALTHNFDLFSQVTGQAVIPVLKANAYGHGISLVATALKSRKFPYIAVDGYFEALAIREVSHQPVLIMGAIKSENYRRIKYDNFAFVVQDAASIRALGETGKSIKVHLEINTGMNRYGTHPSEVVALTRLILSFKNLTLEGVMSHLADSDGVDPQTVNAAVAMFDNTVEVILQQGATPSLFHIGQTAGSLKVISKYANTIRLGIGLYGINPFAPTHPLYKRLADLRPVLRLISTITSTIDLKKGDKVSYNYTFTAPKDMIIGVLPLGYYEGIPRALSNSGTLRVNHHDAPIVGRVCMNHTMISLEGTGAKRGDEVVVYSNNSSDKNAIDSLAHEHNLFNYSLLTGLSSDVRRVLVD